MDTLVALFGSSVVVILILVVFLPQIITTWVMSYKGYSGCLWLFFSFFLSWIGVIIAICMPNIRRQEERHEETLAALTSQSRSQTVILNNQEKSEQTQYIPSSPATDFRLQAIRNLKAIGNSFDEFDLELEIEKIKNQDKESRRKEIAEREQEEQSRREEERIRRIEEETIRQEIKDEKRSQTIKIGCLVVGTVLLLAALSFLS